MKKNKDRWLVWSIEHTAWWREDGRGYTPHRQEAGRYTYDQACKIVSRANYNLDYRFPDEAMILDEI